MFLVRLVLDETMNLQFKEILYNQINERDEHEHEPIIIDTVLTEFELWLQEQESICYIAFDDFNIWL